MNEALVSIIIPVYNAAKYLDETLHSAFNQTWPNIEVILVDDGSTDNSLAIAESYLNRSIKIFKQQNKGASTARNLGLKHAKGSYIQFLDADDILSNDKIAEQMAVLNGTQDYVGLSGAVHFKGNVDFSVKPGEDGWYSAGSENPADFLLKLYASQHVMPGYGGMIQTNSWLTPKKLIDEAGPWNEFKCPDDDGEYFCRVLLAGKGVKFSPKGVNYYRKYDVENSLSGQKSREASEAIVTSIDSKYKHLKARNNSPLLDPIFARHYWEHGVAAYPRYKSISLYCIKKATQLGHKGPKYQGGKISTFLSKVLGWRIVRILTFLRYELK